MRLNTNGRLICWKPADGFSQETRSFDVETGLTMGMREKETMNDYRYFPDPDLAPVVISDAVVWSEIRATGCPPCRKKSTSKFTTHYGLPDYDAALLTDALANWLSTMKPFASETTHYKQASNWVMGPVKAQLTEKIPAQLSIFGFGQSVSCVGEPYCHDGSVSQSAGQQVFRADGRTAAGCYPTGYSYSRKPACRTAIPMRLQTLVDEVLAAWPDKVQQYRKGQKKPAWAVCG